MKNFDSNIPIYLQVMDDIKKQIITGKLKPNDKLSSVRELAQTYAVNPNTIQRTFQELEKEDLVKSERTSGRYVCVDENRINNLRFKMTEKVICDFINELNELGYKENDIPQLLEQVKEKYYER